MIVAIGNDLVDLARLARVLERHGTRFVERILTAGERGYVAGQRDPVPSIGARFAAKEAVMKVLGTGWGDGVGWQDIEVARAPSGKPAIVLHRRAAEHARRLGIRTIHVSLTHTASSALATAVAES